ncbi:UNVERIFIED_ORG: hypothetical protein J2W85_002437 [Ensifer adhaerens]|nr:hypothetical protein [Ensifer adhaerens]
MIKQKQPFHRGGIIELVSARPVSFSCVRAEQSVEKGRTQMASLRLTCMTVASILFSISPVTVVFGQTGDGASQGQGTKTEQNQMPGMTMGGDRMQGMMGGMPMAAMRGHMMKIMFAVADTDGDGGLSFEEVTAVHKRIFASVDANKDGKVTLEEMRVFMRGQ